MNSVSSTPSVTETVQMGEEAGPRRIAFDISRELLQYDTDLGLYFIAMTAAEARQAGTILLSQADDVDRITAAGKP